MDKFLTPQNFYLNKEDYGRGGGDAREWAHADLNLPPPTSARATLELALIGVN